MPGWQDKLNRLPLREFRVLYGSLEIPAALPLQGYYRGSFVGPGWLRASAGPALVVTGLGGWWGKYFAADGRAVNLVRRNTRLEERLPMKLVVESSKIDRKPALALHYALENPFPWPYILDELRQLEPGTLLGMTYLDVGGLRWLVLPFSLQQMEGVDGL